MARSARRLTDEEVLAQIPAARERARAQHHAGLRARAVRYDRKSDRLLLELTNGCLFGIPTEQLTALWRAQPVQLATVRVSPEGAMLSFDELDAEYSVAGLVVSSLHGDDAKREFARLLGGVSTPAKASAARTNGAKGGRPRKTPVRSASAPSKRVNDTAKGKKR